MFWNVRTKIEPTPRVPIAALPHPPVPSGHSIVVESTTGIVACGDSWCRGGCGLPALVVEYEGNQARAFGSQVACGPVLQGFRGRWDGERVHATLGETSLDDAFRLMWW